MSEFYDPNYKVGILGGGQLGRMLIQKAADFDVAIHILDSNPESPCAKLATEFTQGDIRDYDAVYAFAREMDVVSIEIENVNVDALEQVEKEGVAVYPQPALIRMVQDKGLQKQFYNDNNIPTAPFKLLEAGFQLTSVVLPAVQKLRTGGYDGRGVQVLRSSEDLENGFSEASVLEDLVDFEKELSVIVSRNKSGEIRSFPVVELEFNPVANLVEYLFSPAAVSEEIELKAREIAEKLIAKMGMVGILAVEMFLCKDGSILVNEMAPRPHNSGHQTIEGNITSQYEQHLRAILDLPLGDTAITLPSAMVNLLGEEGDEGAVEYEGIEEIISWSGVHPHIYGKKFTKPFRKMGHVTITAESIEKAKELALKVKSTLKATIE